MLVILLITLWNNLNAQDYIPKIRYLSDKDGLSSNVVNAIHKDSRGFMWIGTQNGLNRFDGTEFKVYLPENYSGMTISAVHEIFEDANDYLWLLKKNGNYDHEFRYPEINLLNTATEEITTIEAFFGEKLPFKVQDIMLMQSLKDGRLVFYSANTPSLLHTYDSSTGFQTIPFPKEIAWPKDILLQDDGHYLIHGRKDIKYGYMKYYKVDTNGHIVAENTASLGLTLKEKSQNSKIVLGGNNWNFGDHNLDAYNYYSPDLSYKQGLPGVSEQAMGQANWNEEQGLFWFRNRSNIRVAKPDGTVVFSLEEQLDAKRIPILFEGHTTWLSNKREGLTIIELYPNRFSNYRFFDVDFDNSARGIIKDDEGILWVSTIAGMMKFDESTQTIKEQQRSDVYTRFMKDSKNNFWYYDQSDILKYNLKTKKTEIFDIGRTFGCASWDFFENNDEEIWVSGYNGSIYRINPVSDWYGGRAILPSDMNIGFNVYEYLRKNTEEVWLCTNQGLYIVNNEGTHLATYNKFQADEHFLPAMAIHHIYLDKEGFIWLASGDSGLLKLRMEAGKLALEKQFTVNDGQLSSNSLHAIYEDDYGYLWISSDNGLMQFDKQSDKVTKYFTENGLAHNEFNRIAHFQDKDGQLYFGGLLGVTSFHPKHFADAREMHKSGVPLVVSNFQQFSGQQEQFEDLTTQLISTNTISLQPTDQFFNLKVAMLDYQTAEDITYNYRINGLYDWQTAKSGILSISGLPYGNHTLEIKAQNNNQQEAANKLAIAINVLRPFYLQWWFVLLVLSATMITAWGILKRRTHRLLLQQEAQQLKTLDQMKSRFFANISHELRTPLTLIDLPLKHLINHYEQTSEAQKIQYINSAYKGKEALDRLISEILDLSKLESEQLQLMQAPVPLKSFLARVIGSFQSGAEVKKINYEFNCLIEDHLVVQLDKAKLETVINNLLSNALKFTSEGGTINITARWIAEDKLLFDVQDNGRGIPPEDLPFVFDRYFQAHRPEDALEGGSGIGLAICKEFIVLMGGKIHVLSKWQQGCTFSFTVPLKVLENEETVDHKLPEVIESTPVITAVPPVLYKKKPTILIAEDHPQLRQYLSDIINTRYNVLTAANGKEALELLTENYCQLIVSDIMMPEMDGFALLKKIRSDQRLCGTPFILLTARASMHDRLQGLRIGVDTYLTKPFDTEELLLNIANLLNNAQNRVGLIVEGQAFAKINSSTASPKVIPEDIEWLEQVEIIGVREIKNSQYSVDDLARELFMSRSQVFRKIKKITGLTPRKYFNAIRLQKAKTILETENPHTLTEVCYAVGFDNTTHFAKSYEKEFGKRPHLLLKKSTI